MLEDLYLNILENIEDLSLNKYILPLGYVVNGGLFILKWYKVTHTINDEYFETSDLFVNNSFISPYKSLIYIYNVLMLVLAAVSLLNVYFLFNSYKLYQLFLKDINKEINSKNGYRADNVWQLKVWQPKQSQLDISAILSPVHIYYYYSLSTFGVKSFVFPFLLYVSFAYVIEKFQLLLNDKQIVLSETMNEYNEKYVKPKLSKKYYDALVDATLGPYNPRAYQRFETRHIDKQFKTYSLKDQRKFWNRDQKILHDLVSN